MHFIKNVSKILLIFMIPALSFAMEPSKKNCGDGLSKILNLFTQSPKGAVPAKDVSDLLKTVKEESLNSQSSHPKAPEIAPLQTKNSLPTVIKNLPVKDVEQFTISSDGRRVVTLRGKILEWTLVDPISEMVNGPHKLTKLSIGYESPQFILNKEILRVQNKSDYNFAAFKGDDIIRLMSLSKALGRSLLTSSAIDDVHYYVTTKDQKNPKATLEMIVKFDPSLPDDAQILVLHSYTDKSKARFLDLEESQNLAYFTISGNHVAFAIQKWGTVTVQMVPFDLQTRKVFDALPNETDYISQPLRLKNDLAALFYYSHNEKTGLITYTRIREGITTHWSLSDRLGGDSFSEVEGGILVYQGRGRQTLIFLQDNGQVRIISDNEIEFKHVEVKDGILYGLANDPNLDGNSVVHSISLVDLFVKSKSSLDFIKNKADLDKYLQGKSDYQRTLQFLNSKGEIYTEEAKAQALFKYLVNQNAITDVEFMALLELIPTDHFREYVFDGDRLLRHMKREKLLTWTGTKFNETVTLRFIWMGLSKIRLVSNPLFGTYRNRLRAYVEEAIPPVYVADPQANLLLKEVRSFVLGLHQKVILQYQADFSTNKRP